MLKLSESKVELGRIRVHQPKSFSVNVINNSDSDVKIESIRAGCSKCTQARMDVNVIKAHQGSPLNVVYTPDSTGFITKSVVVNNAVILTFTAHVYN
jgi:hypothetical protein